MVSKQSSTLMFLRMWNQRVVRDVKTLNNEVKRDKILTFVIYY